MNIFTEILILILLIFLSAIFSGSEMAFFSLSRAQVQGLINKKSRFAYLVAKLRKKPQRLLITILLGNNFVNISASILASIIAELYFGSRAIGFVTGIMTFLILVFGEIIPKTYARSHAAPFAQFISPFFRFLTIVFLPAVWLLEVITYWSTRNKSIKPILHFDEELKAMLQVGLKDKQLERFESDLIERTLRFDHLTVRQVMTPWKKIITLDGDVPISQIAYFVSRSPYSRFPVYLKNKDNIIGYIHARDILAAIKSKKRDNNLSSITRQPDFVPETMTIDALFYRMKKHRFRISLVRDRKNKIIGLVSLRDLTEEIVGEYPAPAETIAKKPEKLRQRQRP
ncbi:MAG: hemolysin family protein [Patescibacteria group bacterium]